MQVTARSAATVALGAAAMLGACASSGDGGGGDASCGPTEGKVERVIDGDTIELSGGERVRYLMVDTPEATGGKQECYGPNAALFNTDLVLGKTVALRHDVECRDSFGRALAYVSVAGHEVNALMIERGYACVLHVPPNGDDRAAELDALEATARRARRGLWGACDPIPCR
jgi:micrococcal nuclease